MMTLVGEAWGWVNEYGTGLAALAAVATAVVAIIALQSSASDSRARSQPMVTAGFEPPADSDSSIDFAVSNSGPTPARDLHVTFDPGLNMPKETSRLVAPFIVKRYERAIPVLNPGQRLSNTWWAGEAGGGNELVNREPTPDEVTVTLDYLGVGRRRIVDTFPLTIEIVSLTTYSVSSTSLKGRFKTIDASLKEIASHLKLISKK